MTVYFRNKILHTEWVSCSQPEGWAISLKHEEGNSKAGKTTRYGGFRSQGTQREIPYCNKTMVTESQAGLLTVSNSGHINPRKMIMAQKILATRAGCDVINDVVKKVIPIGSGGYDIEVEERSAGSSESEGLKEGVVGSWDAYW